MTKILLINTHLNFYTRFTPERLTWFSHKMSQSEALYLRWNTPFEIFDVFSFQWSPDGPEMLEIASSLDMPRYSNSCFFRST